MTPEAFLPSSDRPARVILIDDEEIATRTLVNVLGLEPSLEAVAFNDPDEALTHLRGNLVDVIVSDFVMPGMNGLEVLRAAREVQPETSRILLTGYADKASAIESINTIGLFQYIEKPWDNDSFLLALRNAAERTRLLRHLKDGSPVDDLRERLWRMLV